MAKAYIDRIRDAGVAGAGGAGFPTHINISNKAEVVIANGAECEPLLRIDRQMMETFPEKLIEGMQAVMRISKADKGVICLKGKYHLAVEKLTEAIVNKKKIKLHLLDNYYPAGDEQQVVYEVTGKVVPTGGLPIDVGAIVNNVSTLGGVIVLPSEHKVIRKKRSSLDIEYKLAKSVCCQCSYCTQLCPRNVLGLRVEPHKVMRAVGYGDPFTMGDINTIFSCCDCGLCTYYACNMQLSPSRMMTTIKDSLLKKRDEAEKSCTSKG